VHAIRDTEMERCDINTHVPSASWGCPDDDDKQRQAPGLDFVIGVG